jgi:GxxExxY protein
MPRPVNAPVYFEELTYKIIGIAMDIHKKLGPIHKESIYQNALAMAFTNENVGFNKEVRLPVLFQGKQIGIYVPDFVVENKIIVEAKALDTLPLKASVQLTDYLQSTGFKIGLLLNFGSQKLQIRRRING